MPRRPRNLVALTARIAPMERLVIAPELIFTGPSPEGPFASYRDDGRSIATMAYNKPGTVVNLTASYRVTTAITAFAEGRNISGSKFEPANGFQTPGRSLLVGTRFTY
ncbi:TonB-dependent receptor [Leptolyngbya sp. 15MV]|nr:TonB-dependent receptor [Leptolyngbya sp. 15MV]